MTDALYDEAVGPRGPHARWAVRPPVTEWTTDSLDFMADAHDLARAEMMRDVNVAAERRAERRAERERRWQESLICARAGCRNDASLLVAYCESCRIELARNRDAAREAERDYLNALPPTIRGRWTVDGFVEFVGEVQRVNACQVDRETEPYPEWIEAMLAASGIDPYAS